MILTFYILRELDDGDVVEVVTDERLNHLLDVVSDICRGRVDRRTKVFKYKKTIASKVLLETRLLCSIPTVVSDGLDDLGRAKVIEVLPQMAVEPVAGLFTK